MKRNFLAMWITGAAMVAVAGVAQAAGRGIDSPIMHTTRAVESAGAVSSGIVYSGRRVDQQHSPRERTEGAAEFAVMDLQEEAAETRRAAYHGRPMDSLHLIR